MANLMICSRGSGNGRTGSGNTRKVGLMGSWTWTVRSADSRDFALQGDRDALQSSKCDASHTNVDALEGFHVRTGYLKSEVRAYCWPRSKPE